MRSNSKQDQARARRKWSDEEDARLLDFTRKLGLDAWRSISAQMNDRDPKQCRERYMNHLDPNVKKEKLSLLEWKTLLLAHDEFGNKWSDIAQRLPGRTPNTLKNFWHSTLRPSAIEEIFGTEAYNLGQRVPKIAFDGRGLEIESTSFRGRPGIQIANIPIKTFSRSHSPDRMEVDDDESTSSHNVSNNNTALSSPRDYPPTLASMASADSLVFPSAMIGSSSATSSATVSPFMSSKFASAPTQVSSTSSPFASAPLSSLFSSTPSPSPFASTLVSPFNSALLSSAPSTMPSQSDDMEIDTPKPQINIFASAPANMVNPFASDNSKKQQTPLTPRSLTSSAPLPYLWDALVETAMDEYNREVEVAKSHAVIIQQQQQQQQQYYQYMRGLVGTNSSFPPTLLSSQFPMAQPPPQFGPNVGFDSSKQFQFWTH